MTNTVSFDPGLGKLASDLYSEVYIIENDLAHMPQFARKARYYSVTYKKIVKAILNNLGFYKGCLAWAYYIKNNNNDANLIGNPFVNMTEEQKSQYAPTDMVDFLIEYMDKFKSDLRYYNIKGVALPNDTGEILSKYREFVAMNEGFINTNNVSEIKLPENLIFNTNLDEIKAKIDNAIENQNLDELLSL